MYVFTSFSHVGTKERMNSSFICIEILYDQNSHSEKRISSGLMCVFRGREERIEEKGTNIHMSSSVLRVIGDYYFHPRGAM